MNDQTNYNMDRNDRNINNSTAEEILVQKIAVQQIAVQQIVVLCGGESEREISLRSGQSVSAALNKLHVPHTLVDLRNKEEANIFLSHAKPELILNLLHGGWGESGYIQKIFEDLKLKQSGSNSKACYIMMDKYLSREIAKKINILCAPGGLFSKDVYKSQYKQFPHVVKTVVGGGSSVGVDRINNHDEKTSYCEYWTDENPRLVEEFINGLEYSVAIINNEIFGGTEISYNAQICDYYTKYNTSTHSPESDKFFQAIQRANQMALAFYKELHCNGFVRIDFMIDEKTHIPYFIEANPNPGMTATSILPDIALFNQDMNYTDLVQFILKNCLN